MTNEQKTIRLGRITGSEIYKLMGAKGLGKTGQTYIFEKASESLTGQPTRQEFTAASTSWGNDHEQEAKDYFKAATGVEIQEATTIDNGLICGTPDGITHDFGFEIKCPFNSGNHLKNLSMLDANSLLELSPEYYWQCVAYMWLTGLNRWKFCSYDPRFPEGKKMLILNLELNPAHLKLLKNRVNEAQLLFNNIISKI